MEQSKAAAMRAREVKERDEIRRTVATLGRHSLASALHMAADVMQNSAAVAKSDAWKGHYRQLMNDYRTVAHLVGCGAKFAIKE